MTGSDRRGSGGPGYEKISPTAAIVAYLRSFSDIPYAKEMARESGAEEVYRRVHGEPGGRAPRFAPLWEARYKLTNRILRGLGSDQVLELAAGLSPRGLEFTRDPEVTYVASDLDEMLQAERQVVERILRSEGPRPNLHFAVADAVGGEGLSRAAAPFARGEPIAVVTEGLIPYLDRQERTALAGNVRRLLEGSGGHWVASDVRTRESVERSPSYSRRAQRLSGLVGRDIEANLFADGPDMRRFFQDARFEVEERTYGEVLGELTTPDLAARDAGVASLARAVFEGSKTLLLTPSRG